MKARTLGRLHPGQQAVIRQLNGPEKLRHRLADMGLTPGAQVRLKKTAPLGDPLEIEVRGYALTLRRRDAEAVGLFAEGGARGWKKQP